MENKIVYKIVHTVPKIVKKVVDRFKKYFDTSELEEQIKLGRTK